MDVEDRVVEFLGDRAEGGILCGTGIREHDIEPALFLLDLREEAIEIAKVRHVSSYAGHISSDLRCRRGQLRICASGDEDVCAFLDELLRRCKADTATGAGYECNFSCKLAHEFLRMHALHGAEAQSANLCSHCCRWV